MQKSSRRTFLIQAAIASTAVAGAKVFAQTAVPKLDDSDPRTAALGYKQDTSKVDAKKYPNHTIAQKCGGCQMFQGKAGDAFGNCPLFAGKQVSSSGWCSAWAKKAA